jgi:peptide-methionine (R)-S-oxide reductase
VGQLKQVLQSILNQVTRWRVLVIALVAFAGLVAISSSKGDRSKDGATEPEVTIVEFSDVGARIGPARVKRVVHTDAEWRKLLSADQFYVTRKQSTDIPYSGTYYRIHEPGVFRCICCGTALFGSDTKYDSGTGWPSFWAPIAPENVRAHQDRSLFLERTEVVCARCGAHLGHVFDDGPEPTHLRYCINESSLRFVARAR